MADIFVRTVDPIERALGNLRTIYKIQTDKEVAVAHAAAIFVFCESCHDEPISLRRLLQGDGPAGGWLLGSRHFLVEVDDEGRRHYSYFCPDGHFNDDVTMPVITQVALTAAGVFEPPSLTRSPEEQSFQIIDGEVPQHLAGLVEPASEAVA